MVGFEKDASTSGNSLNPHHEPRGNKSSENVIVPYITILWYSYMGVYVYYSNRHISRIYTSIDAITCYNSTWNDNVVTGESDCLVDTLCFCGMFCIAIAIAVRGYMRLLNRDLHFSFHVHLHLYTHAISTLTHLLTIWGVVYYFLLLPRL